MASNKSGEHEVSGSNSCRCERCKRVVERPSGSLFWKVALGLSYLSILPYLAMCAVTGLGIFAFVPLTAALGMSLSVLLGPKAFPRQLCSECGASLPEPRRAAAEESSSGVLRIA